MVEIKLYSIQTKTPSPSKLNDFPFVYSLMNNDEKQKTLRKKKTRMRERRYFCLPAPRSLYKLEIQRKCWHLTLHIFCTTSRTAMFIYDLRDSVCFFLLHVMKFRFMNLNVLSCESLNCSWLQSPHLEMLIIIKCLPQCEYILVNINNMIYTSCSFKYIAVYEVIMLWVLSLSPLTDCVSRQEGDKRVSERGNKVRNLATRDFVV